MHLRIFLSCLLFLVSTGGFAFIDPHDVPWLEDLKQSKLFFFHVCGSANILPTTQSLNRDFAFGSEKLGYFFTEAPGIGEYWSLIKESSQEDAKTALRSRFSKTHLWSHSVKGLMDLGTPTKMDFPFQASIKDCMAGSKNSMGMECRPGQDRASCCSEKFVGPLFYWGPNQEYVLKFSPDPSVKLKVKGERKNRFCNFQQVIEIKGSGR